MFVVTLNQEGPDEAIKRKDALLRISATDPLPRGPQAAMESPSVHLGGATSSATRNGEGFWELSGSWGEEGPGGPRGTGAEEVAEEVAALRARNAELETALVMQRAAAEEAAALRRRTSFLEEALTVTALRPENPLLKLRGKYLLPVLNFSFPGFK
eukprot:8185460-Pyramimonas_sp.AAC.1